MAVSLQLKALHPTFYGELDSITAGHHFQSQGIEAMIIPLCPAPASSPTFISKNHSSRPPSFCYKGGVNIALGPARRWTPPLLQHPRQLFVFYQVRELPEVERYIFLSIRRPSTPEFLAHHVFSCSYPSRETTYHIRRWRQTVPDSSSGQLSPAPISGGAASATWPPSVRVFAPKNGEPLCTPEEHV